MPTVRQADAIAENGLTRDNSNRPKLLDFWAKSSIQLSHRFRLQKIRGRDRDLDNKTGRLTNSCRRPIPARLLGSNIRKECAPPLQLRICRIVRPQGANPGVSEP